MLLPYQFVYVELQSSIVALLGVVKMNEEEDVCPDVMLIVDMMLKALREK